MLLSFDEKVDTLLKFLGGEMLHDTMVVLSRDETEDITAANEAIRKLEAPEHNVILCIGADSPIIITPKTGIAPRTRTLLLVDGIPDTWSTKENVVEFELAEQPKPASDLVKVKKLD